MLGLRTLRQLKRNQRPLRRSQRPFETGDVAPQRTVQPLLVLNLQGTQAQMGAQHGRMLRQIGGYHPIVEFYPTMVQRLIASGFPPDKRPPMLETLVDGICRWALEQFEGNRPLEFKQRSQAFVEALGEPGLASSHIHIMDLLQNFIGLAARFKLTPISKRFGPHIAPACSSMAVWNQASADGTMLHARNFDLPGVGVWDTAQTVVFCKPDRGLRYGFVTARGGDVPAITSFNEAGISVSTHSRLHRDVNFSGATITDLAHEITLRAETLDDALRIAKRQSVASSWGILVSSAREKRALHIETTSKSATALAPAADESFLAVTNRFRASEHLHREVTTTPAWLVNSDSREALLQNAARKASANGGFSTRDLERLIGSNQPPTLERERPTGAVLAQAINVHAVVVEPEKQSLRVSVGTAPTCWGPYLSVPWNWDRGVDCQEITDHLQPEIGDEQPPEIHSPRLAEGEIGKAYDHFREALRRYTGFSDFAGARRHMERAINQSADDPTYRFLAGAMQVQYGDFNRALSHFEHALRFENHPFYRGNTLLWASRAASAANFPGRAATLRSELLTIDHPQLSEHHEQARTERTTPIPASRLRHTAVNFLLIDAGVN